MILTILGILAIAYVVAFFGVMTWAVWYYGRDLHRTVTQYPPHRNGWDHADEDEHGRVTGPGPEDYAAIEADRDIERGRLR